MKLCVCVCCLACIGQAYALTIQLTFNFRQSTTHIKNTKGLAELVDNLPSDLFAKKSNFMQNEKLFLSSFFCSK